VRASTKASKIAALTFTKKASDVVVMDLRGLTTMADFFVLCSADSDVQMRAVADAVDDGMNKLGVTPWHREGGGASWVLLDYVDVVLHIFHTPARTFYNLEKLWGDAKISRLSDTPATPRPRRTKATR